MGIVVRRNVDLDRDQRIINEARKRVASVNTNEDFLIVAKKFVDCVKQIRAAMKKAGSSDYENFFGGYEECDKLVQDPIYMECKEAQFGYQLLLGVNAWLIHEAEKLGEIYKSPNHFFLAWKLIEGIDLRLMRKV